MGSQTDSSRDLREAVHLGQMDLHSVGLFPGSKARKIIPITGRIHSFIHLTNIY